MATPSINSELMQKFIDLSNQYFLSVMNRAAKENGSDEVSEAQVRTILENDKGLRLSPSVNINQTNESNLRQEAQKQIELNNELRPMLAMIAGITPSLISEFNANLQMGLAAGNRGATNSLAHPKLEPFLDQAASSFLDAYRQVQDEQNQNKDQTPENKQEDALRNTNDLTLQYKNRLRMQMQSAPKAKPEMQPQYTPTIKLRPNT